MSVQLPKRALSKHAYAHASLPVSQSACRQLYNDVRLESCLSEFKFTPTPDAVSYWTGSQGGAIYMVNGTSLAVEDSSFTNNTALTGGGIFMSRVADTYIYNNQFYHNNVSQAGGGINSGKHFLVGKCTNMRLMHDFWKNSGNALNVAIHLTVIMTLLIAALHAGA